MIDCNVFIDACLESGIRLVSGVPCSHLTPFINALLSQDRIRYVGASSEGEAVGIACGATLSGAGAAVICQNSGLGNMVNPLTSLAWPFRLPLLLISTWRGRPGSVDEPQHELMGQITPDLLELLGVRHRPFPTCEADVRNTIAAEVSRMRESGRSSCLMLDKEVFMHCDAPPAPARRSAAILEIEDFRDGRAPARRADLLERVLKATPDDVALITTTGKCGRELFTLADREQQLYLVGSMGCASAVGLGVSLMSDRQVVVLDGDGAALMKLGNLATIGATAPSNLVHVIIDNGVHDSTGGQPTSSHVVDFPAMATAAGYRSVLCCDSSAGFEAAYRRALAAEGPVMLHASVSPGSMSPLGRPTVDPIDVARRFSAFLSSGAGLSSGTRSPNPGDDEASRCR